MASEKSYFSFTSLPGTVRDRDIVREISFSECDVRHRTKKWRYDLPDPDAMDRPPTPTSSPPPERRRDDFAIPFVELDEIEDLVYGLEPLRVGKPPAWAFHNPRHFEVPLGLLRRYKREQRWLREQQRDNDYHDGMPFRAGEMIHRRWEQVFASRLPPIKIPENTIVNGKILPEDADMPPWYFEDYFVTEILLPSLELIGEYRDHPSQRIRMPLELASHLDWQIYAEDQGRYLAEKMQHRHPWIPFLLTRPFVVFEAIADKAMRRCNWTREMVLTHWKKNGYCMGGQWTQGASHDVGWFWPCEKPKCFLDDMVHTWELATLWPGDPEHPRGRHESPQAEPITDEELARDPTLAQRPQDWRKSYERLKRREARASAAAASAIDVRNCIDGDPPASRDEPRKRYLEDYWAEPKEKTPEKEKAQNTKRHKMKLRMRKVREKKQEKRRAQEELKESQHTHRPERQGSEPEDAQRPPRRSSRLAGLTVDDEQQA